MKHIKTYENWLPHLITGFIAGIFLFKFLKGILRSRLQKRVDVASEEYLSVLLDAIKRSDKIPINDFNDRYFMRFKVGSLNMIYDYLKKEKH